MLEFALYFLQLSKFQENKFLFFFIFGPLAEKGYILIQKSTIEFFPATPEPMVVICLLANFHCHTILPEVYLC